jgi:SAM-dependent methyltransferase
MALQLDQNIVYNETMSASSVTSENLQSDTGGYGRATDYLYDYSLGISPTFHRFNMLLRGYDVPIVNDRRAHCDLGCGHGISLNIHAAGCRDAYVGVDFNAALTRTAIQLAEASQADVRVITSSFSELLSRDDLPMFDTISMQYVWSWIDDRSRTAVMDFVGRHLKPGGSFYVSYQCSPGWDPIQHFRTILSIADRALPASGGDDQQEQAAAQFLAGFFSTATQSATTVDVMRNFFSWMSSADRHTRRHLYENRNWKCFSLADVARTCHDVGLEYIGTGSVNDYIDQGRLNQDAIRLLDSVPAASDRDQLYDMLVNRNFRQDIYVRDAKKLSPECRRDRLMSCRASLVKPVSEIDAAVDELQSLHNEDAEADARVLKALVGFYGRAVTLSELADLLSTETADDLISSMARLVSQALIVPCRDENVDEQIVSQSQKLNTMLCEHALFRDDARALVSPVTGVGVPVSRVSQMFLRARNNGASCVEEYKHALVVMLNERGEYLVKDGVKLSGDELTKELWMLAERFESVELPMLILLGVIPG